MASKAAQHLKAHGHGYVIVCSVIFLVGFVVLAKFFGNYDDDRLISEGAVVVFSGTSLFGALLTLVLLALTAKEQLGDFSDLKIYLIIGLLFASFFAAVKLLSIGTILLGAVKG